MNHEEDPPFPSSAFPELFSRIIDVLSKIPPLPIPIPILTSSSNSSPAVFASLFIGISLALILFGAITLLIGFVLMPVVVSLLLLFYFFNLLSIFSNLAHSILCPFPLDSPKPKDVSAVPPEDSCCCCCSIPPPLITT